MRVTMEAEAEVRMPNPWLALDLGTDPAERIRQDGREYVRFLAGDPEVNGTAGLALILVALGLAGRRVGDHPHCRRCGFDLFGNPSAAVCPECGGDLSWRRAVRTGQRKRRRGMLVAGLALLAPAVLVAGVVAWGTMRDVKWV